MRTLHSHKFFPIVFSLLLVAPGVNSACSSKTTKRVLLQPGSDQRAGTAININTASALELEKLPHLGPVLAERIIEHRNRYGSFRRAEHLLAVEGISEKRFRDLKQFIDTK